MTTTLQELQELKRCFERRAGKMCDGKTFNGIEYDWEIAGSRGCWVRLFPHEHHTDDEINRAKSAARTDRDVVSFSVVRVPKSWYDEEQFTPAATDESAKEPDWVATCRWVKEHHSAARMDRESGQRIPDSKRGGVLIDAFSAGMILAVVDSINDKNREKLFAMEIPVAIHICMSLHRR